jgi:hypothetical protein
MNPNPRLERSLPPDRHLEGVPPIAFSKWLEGTEAPTYPIKAFNETSGVGRANLDLVQGEWAERYSNWLEEIPRHQARIERRQEKSRERTERKRSKGSRPPSLKPLPHRIRKFPPAAPRISSRILLSDLDKLGLLGDGSE